MGIVRVRLVLVFFYRCVMFFCIIFVLVNRERNRINFSRKNKIKSFYGKYICCMILVKILNVFLYWK